MDNFTVCDLTGSHAQRIPFYLTKHYPANVPCSPTRSMFQMLHDASQPWKNQLCFFSFTYPRS